jgi:pimeloyl-ACP methyl ester carboxylesterase
MPLAHLDDADIYYKIRGEGPPVLGIMGFGLDQRYWAAQIPPIIEHNSFITFDNRGAGRSTGALVTTIDEMAHDAIRLLDHLEIEKTIVFGVSMGGAIAQRLVLDNPDRVSALILGITWARPLEFMRRQEGLARLLVEAGGAKALVEASLVKMFTPRFFEMGEEAIDRLVASLDAPGAPEMMAQEGLHAQLEAIEKHDTLDELPKIQVPTLVFGGKMDQMVPGFASEEIAAAIPGARFHMFETGHGAMIEEMQDVNELISDFLGSLR